MVLACGVLLLTAACSGLAGEPRIVSSLPPPTPAPPVVTQEVAAPASTPEVPAPASTQEVNGTGNVTGAVSNGTLGGSVPTGLTATLHIFDNQLNQQTFDAPVTANNTFTFSGVPIRSDSSYIISVPYRGRVFTSGVSAGNSLTLDMPMKIYELTEDPTVISITGIVSQVTVVANGLQVVEVWNIKNSSDRLFTSSESVGAGQHPSVVVTLPPGSSILGFPDNQQRYIVNQSQFTVVDTVPVVPGEDHIVEIVYLVPYTDSAIIEQPVNYALNGPVRLLVSPATVQATSQQLPPLGPQTVGQTQYEGYGATLTLNAGDVVRYELNGAGAASTSTSGVVTSGDLPILIGLIIAGLIVFTAILYAIYSRQGRRLLTPKKATGALPAEQKPAPEQKAAVKRPSPTTKQQLMDGLIRQIAELDADHEAGQIAAEAYERQRSQLKARLAELMEED